jgi:hypothetical protein
MVTWFKKDSKLRKTLALRNKSLIWLGAFSWKSWFFFPTNPRRVLIFLRPGSSGVLLANKNYHPSDCGWKYCWIGYWPGVQGRFMVFHRVVPQWLGLCHTIPRCAGE